MGRGTIAGGGAAGLYSLALDVGVAERTAAVAKLDERLAVLVEPIAVLEASLAAAEAARDEAREAAHAAIDAYAAAMQADPEGDHTALTDEIEARSARAMELEGVAAQSRIALQMLEAEKAQLERDRTALLAVEVERTVNAWCVDLTENASGAVATVEVPGEPAQVLIAPGGRAPAEADGRLLARGVMSPAQAFWNAAVLPGWQKFKPDYRTGTLTALDQVANRATVALDALTSSAQGLLVNQANTLVDVPVVYMTCNAQAFEVGDRVVVAFGGRDWTARTVVGFVTNPKPCLPNYVDVWFSVERGAWEVSGEPTLAHGLCTRNNFYYNSFVEVSALGYEIPQKRREVRLRAGPGWTLPPAFPGSDVEVTLPSGALWSELEGWAQSLSTPHLDLSMPYTFRPNRDGAFLQRMVGKVVPGVEGVADWTTALEFIDGAFRWVATPTRYETRTFLSTWTTTSDPNEWADPMFDYEVEIAGDAAAIEAAISAPATMDVRRGAGTPLGFEYLGVRWNAIAGQWVMRYGRPGWTEEV